MITIASVAILVFLLLFAFAPHQRKAIFKRDGATCTGCGRKWDDGWMLECHHIVPLSQGGENTESNGALVCRDCHLKAHVALFNAAEDKKARNDNARAVRIIKKRIKDKGLRRYGYE